MSSANLIHDPNAGGDVEANLNFEADGLTVFGPTGRKLQHWPYGEIVHAFPKGEGMDRFLAHVGRPEIRLRVGHAVSYDAIAARAPQLRRRPPIAWRELLEAVPEEFHLALFVALFGSTTAGLYLLLHLLE